MENAIADDGQVYFVRRNGVAPGKVVLDRTCKTKGGFELQYADRVNNDDG
jgi:hypothetical protein